MDALKEYIPPAFPNHRQTNENGEVLVYESEGLTMRDYFAAHATQEDIHHLMYKFGPDEHTQIMTREQAKYAHADAMLKARK
jgi:hypothetical protein